MSTITHHPDREPIELELLYLSMLVRGVYTWERRISFFSTEHDDADVDAVFDAITDAIGEIRANGFDWSIEATPDPQFRPLTSAERRMFVLAQHDGGDLPYHLPHDGLLAHDLRIGNDVGGTRDRVSQLDAITGSADHVAKPVAVEPIAKRHRVTRLASGGQFKHRPPDHPMILAVEIVLGQAVRHGLDLFR